MQYDRDALYMYSVEAAARGSPLKEDVQGPPLPHHTSEGLMRRAQPPESRGEKKWRVDGSEKQGERAEREWWGMVLKSSRAAPQLCCFYSLLWRHPRCLCCVSAQHISSDHSSIKKCRPDVDIVSLRSVCLKSFSSVRLFFLEYIFALATHTTSLLWHLCNVLQRHLWMIAC